MRILQIRFKTLEHCRFFFEAPYIYLFKFCKVLLQCKFDAL